MLSKENIKISYQCPANWDNMISGNKGRFCDNCNKTVYDFTDKSFTDFRKLYIEHDGNLCGRFKTSQTVKASGQSKLNRLFVALLLVFGYNLSGSDVKAQTVSQLSDSTEYKELIDTTVENIVFGMVAESLPIYKNGGDKGLMEFLSKNIKYPLHCPDGKVIVSFTVDKTGKVKDAKITSSLREDADIEVIRVVNLLEFIPGEQLGRKADVKYSVPFSFKRL